MHKLNNLVQRPLTFQNRVIKDKPLFGLVASRVELGQINLGFRGQELNGLQKSGDNLLFCFVFIGLKLFKGLFLLDNLVPISQKPQIALNDIFLFRDLFLNHIQPRKHRPQKKGIKQGQDDGRDGEIKDLLLGIR